MSEHRYRQLVADVAKGEGSNAQATDLLTSEVRDAAQQGEPWALETLDRWCRTGAAKDFNKAHKAINGVSVTKVNGSKQKQTTSYSRPVRDTETGETAGYQMAITWDMTRNELIALDDDLSRQVGRLVDSRRVVRALLTAMEQHPECETARCAWLAEGRSLTEIDLNEVAS